MTFEERNKHLIGVISFDEQLSKATPLHFPTKKMRKQDFWHRSRGFRNLREEIESIIEHSKFQDYYYDADVGDEYPIEVLNSNGAANRILKYLLSKHLLK